MAIHSRKWGQGSCVSPGRGGSSPPKVMARSIEQASSRITVWKILRANGCSREGRRDFESPKISIFLKIGWCWVIFSVSTAIFDKAYYLFTLKEILEG